MRHWVGLGPAPWRLALVTVFQVLEHLSDRQAADAVRARIDRAHALGLDLADPGFHLGVPSEFRARFIASGAEHPLLDTRPGRLRTRGLGRPRGRPRTDGTQVLAAVHGLRLLELAAGTLRATLDDPAAVAPDRLRGIARPVWFERHGRRVEDHRRPRRREGREALALGIGADGFAWPDALDASETPAAARAMPMLQTLRDLWRGPHARRDDGRPRWRAGGELPPVGARPQSPPDPQARCGTKRGAARGGARHEAGRGTRRGMERSGHLGRTSPRPATRLRRTWSRG